MAQRTNLSGERLASSRVFWHVEKGSMAIHSRHLTCTASEVAAAIEGMMRHATTMKARGELRRLPWPVRDRLRADPADRLRHAPRSRQINTAKLYRPGREDEITYDRLADAMTRPIRWDIIAPSWQ
ncbi:hypothetical protein ACFZAV_39660 [Streptomyces sp. NPDC008343]|uniref:hypothetical protein n=1 Tax=Streptomyces sp. NPDC008343 TaxID=3364828 RepID=UPI0036E2B2FE